MKKHYISSEESSVLSLFMNLLIFSKFLSFSFIKSLKKSKDVYITKALTFYTLSKRFLTRSSISVSSRTAVIRVST